MQRKETSIRNKLEMLVFCTSLLAWLATGCMPIENRYPASQAPELPVSVGLPIPELTADYILNPSQEEIDFIIENAKIPESLENQTGYRTALTLLKRYFYLTGEPDDKGRVGWIDVTRITPHHPAFAEALDFVASRNFSPENEDTSGDSIATASSKHANMALHFLTQIGAGGTAGLAQSDWAEGVFTTISDEATTQTPDSLRRCAAAITYLVDSGVGVIGIIPTWHETQVDPSSMVEFLGALQYARMNNVFVVVAGGNMGVDLGSPNLLRRPLHDVVNTGVYPNFWSMGGIDEAGQRAVWPTTGIGNHQEGSNYGFNPETGVPYMSFVSLATDRLVPGTSEAGFLSWRGTTFPTGEMAGAIAAVQAILGKDQQGRWPEIKFVMTFFTETSEVASDPQLARFGIPRYDRAVIAAIKWKLAHDKQ